MGTKDTIQVASLPGLEPEEQPITREVDLPIAVKGSLTGETLGALPAQAQIGGSAGEFAANLRKICGNCKHFDQIKAQKTFLEYSDTPSGQQELANLRANLLFLEEDPHAAMAQLGYCHAFSEIRKVDVIVHPLGHCPDTSYGFGDLFKPIDRAAEARGDHGYDQIMQQASGKIIL